MVPVERLVSCNDITIYDPMHQRSVNSAHRPDHNRKLAMAHNIVWLQSGEDRIRWVREMKSYVSSLPFQVQGNKMERGEHAAPKVEDPNVVTIKTEEVWVDDVDDDEELVSVGEDCGVVVDDHDGEGEGESNGTADDNNNDGRPGGKTKTEKKRAYQKAYQKHYNEKHRDQHKSKERLRRMALKIDFDQLKDQGVNSIALLNFLLTFLVLWDIL